MAANEMLLIAAVILLVVGLAVALSDRGTGGALVTIGAALLAVGFGKRKSEDGGDAR